MKRRDLERHLTNHGCRQVDEGGNHTRWLGPEGARSVVPRHREIDYGLAQDMSATGCAATGRLTLRSLVWGGGIQSSARHVRLEHW